MKLNTFLLIVAAIFGCRLSAQTTYHVDAAAAAGGNGTAASPFKTIAPAMSAAVSGDSVLVMPGTYGGQIDFQGKAITLYSLLGRTVTTLTANNTLGDGSILVTGSGASLARIIGFTIKEIPGRNLVVKIDGSSVEFNDCTFTIDYIEYRNQVQTFIVDNCLLDGTHVIHTVGGALIPGSSALFKDTEFKNQAYTDGFYPYAAINLQAEQMTIDTCNIHDSIRPFLSSPKNLLIVDSTFTSIPTAVSNAAQNHGSQWEIRNSTFFQVATPISGSQSGGYGIGSSFALKQVTADLCGPWEIIGQDVTLEDLEITNASATSSGLLTLTAGTVEITSSTLSNCSVPILIAGTNTSFDLEMHGCIVADCSGTIGSTGALMIDHGTFWNNDPIYGVLLTAPDGILARDSVFVGGSGALAGNNAVLESCNVQGGWAGSGANNIDVPALFVDPMNGDFHLQPTSPMIDRGTAVSLGASELDIDGDARVIGRYSDIGADEFDSGAFALRGTDEDFTMITKINLARVNGLAVDVAGGDLVSLTVSSPGADFVGAPVYVFGEVFTTGGSPILPVGHPQVHMNLLNADLLFDPVIASGLPGWSFGLPSSGLSLSGPVPFGFSGVSYRIQAFAVWPLAANGWYAATDAVDLVHP